MELLESGKVLAAGGKGGETSSELFNPVTGIWTLTDSLNTVMIEPIPSVILLNGKILASGSTNSELYDSRPMVSVEQALGQSDPTDAGPINFTAKFNEPIVEASFDETDVILGGTAGAANVVISEISPYDSTTFNVAVSGMRSGGSVTASIPAGVVEDSIGNKNLASASTDNEVTLNGYVLTVTHSPTDSGSITLVPEFVSYIYGTEVILTPIPSPGFLFSDWTGANAGDLVSNGDETWSIIMNSNEDIIANFVPDTSLFSTYLPLILKKP